MNKPNIKSSQLVVPMIYAYTTPGITYHDGYIKIGYTEQDVDIRIRQQTHTAGVKPQKEWQGNAIFEDGTGDTFTDKQFHTYLRKNVLSSLRMKEMNILIRTMRMSGFT